MRKFVGYTNLFIESGCSKEKIAATVSAPVETKEGDWSSDVNLSGISNEGKYTIFGADEVQAVQLAIRFINDLLVDSEELKMGKLFIALGGGDFEMLDKEYFTT